MIGTAMPASAARSGRTNRLRSRSSPRSNSRRASSPTTKKKNVIRPLLTQCRRSREMPCPPRSIERVVLQKRSYDDASAFAHASATIAATRRIAAPPVSVRRNSRSGVWMLRAHAVRPEKGAAGRLSSLSPRPRRLRDHLRPVKDLPDREARDHVRMIVSRATVRGTTSPGARPEAGHRGRVARTESGIAEAATARTAAQAPAPVIGLRRSFPARDGGLASSGTCRLGAIQAAAGTSTSLKWRPRNAAYA